MMRRGRSSTALVLPVYGARLHARVTLLTRHTRPDARGVGRGGRGLLDATKNWHLLSHNQRRVIAYRFVTHRRYIDVREPIEEQNFKMHAMSASHITQ